MELPEGFKITTQVLLQGVLLFVVLDLFAVPLLTWRISTDRFGRLLPWLAISGYLTWFLIWAWAISVYWGSVYRFVFAGFPPQWLPPAMALLETAGTLLAAWIASRLFRRATLWFCLFGGIWGALTHLWALHRGIVRLPPMLQGAAPWAAVLVAVFEIMFYFCVILALASLLEWAVGKFQAHESKLA
jgi:hypothetical protein